MVHRYCGLTSRRLSGETHGARSRREGVGGSFVRALAGTPEMRQQVLAGRIAGRRHGLRSSVKRAVSIGYSMQCVGFGAGGAHCGCMRHQPWASRRKPGRRQARGRVRLRSGRQPLGAQGGRSTRTGARCTADHYNGRGTGCRSGSLDVTRRATNDSTRLERAGRNARTARLLRSRVRGGPASLHRKAVLLEPVCSDVRFPLTDRCRRCRKLPGRADAWRRPTSIKLAHTASVTPPESGAF